MMPKEIALNTRLMTESVEKRTSKSAVCSHVNHIRVKKPKYDVSAEAGQYWLSSARLRRLTIATIHLVVLGEDGKVGDKEQVVE
jgi:hypothetical protein